MAVALVWNSGLQQADATSGSFDVNHPSNPAAGNLLTVEIVHYVTDTSSCSISDSEGGTWTRVVQQLNAGSTLSSEIWARPNVAASSGTFTITLTLGTGFDNYISWAAQEWSGVEATPLKTTGAALSDWGDTITVSTSGGTAPAVGDLIISNVVSLQGSTNNGYTPPAGYTTLFVEQNSSAHQGGIASYRTVGTAGHQTVDVEATASMYRAGVLAVFAAATSGDVTVGGQTLSVAASVVPGSASGVRSTTASGATLEVQASVLAGEVTGAIGATAEGATLSVAASLLPGAAQTQIGVSVSGATLSVAASLIDGTVTAGTDAQASGGTLTVAASVISGSVTVDVAAAGQTLTSNVSVQPGSAVGQRNVSTDGLTLSVGVALLTGAAAAERNVTASGQEMAVAAGLLPGQAEGVRNVAAGGDVLAVGVSVSAGSVTAARTVDVDGVELGAVAVSLIAGSAAGGSGVVASGATLTVSAGVIPGQASAELGVIVPGAVLAASVSLIAGTAGAGVSVTAAGQTLGITASLIPGGAFSIAPGTPSQARVQSRVASRDKDLPPVPASLAPEVRSLLERMREAVQRLMGNRGEPGRSAVLWDDLGAAGLANAHRRRVTLADAIFGPGGVGGIGGGSPAPDLSPPPTPTGLSAVAGFSNVLIEWDAPIYVQGHGHKQTNIYATKQAADDPTLYVITDAVKVDSAPGALTMRALPSDTFIKWRIWIKWESVDGVESPPAGGVNGFVVTTGKIGEGDVSDLVIKARHLADGAVDLITGKVTADGEFGAIAVGYTVTQYLLATSGLLQHLVVDNAQIANLSAAKLSVGDGTIGGNLKSANYSNALALGWLVRPDGYAEFNNVVIRGATYTGTIYANAGTIGGVIIGPDYLRSGQLGWDNGTGFYLGSDGTLSVGTSGGKKITWDGVDITIVADGLVVQGGNATLSGALNGATGTFNGVLGAGVVSSSAFDAIIVELDAAGTFNLTAPALKPGWSSMSMRVTLQGGGGGGGGGYRSGQPNADPAAGGGGGGAGSRVIQEVSAIAEGDPITVVVGAAGAGGHPGASWGGNPGATAPAGTGTNGGASTVTHDGATYSASGGTGGVGGSANYAYGGGGSVGAPVFNVPGGSLGGGAGGSLLGNNTGTWAPAGAGGSSFYGSGGAADQDALGLGAGGGGGTGSGVHWGRAGRHGYVRIEFYDPNTVVLNQRYSALVAWLDLQGHGPVPPAAR